MKNYEVILFDLDDTLINDTESRRFAYKKMVNYFEIPYTEEGFFRWITFDTHYWKVSVNHVVVPGYAQKTEESYVRYIRSYRYFLFFGGKLSLEDALSYNESYLKSLTELIVPMPNARQILSYLWNRYSLYIATEGPSQNVSKKLQEMECLEYFKGFFSSDMTKSHSGKPNPLFFEELLEYISYSDKKKILLVGDSIEKDIALAKNVQVDSVWYNPKGIANPTYTPTYEIQDLLELKRVL